MISPQRFFLLVLAVVVLVGADAPEEPLSQTEIENFLRTAKVVDREPLEIGVTHSHRLTLSQGSRTLRAVWKTIDETAPIKRFDRGLPELGFVDTYKNEIAAYELDKLLGLDMVPPTVARKIGRHKGSVQLWIDDCITEGERFKRKMMPPNVDAWFRQVQKIRLFRQLIHDTDYINASNFLCDPDFKIWSVDHSRGFRTQKVLLNGEYLHRFSRALLARLRQLDRATLDEKLGPWMGPGALDGLMARKALILDHAEALITEKGEEKVLYP